MRVILLSLFFLFGAMPVLCSLDTLHAEERRHSWPQWQQRRVALDRKFVAEEFRIYYTLTGPDALPMADQTDSDGDGVPDKIQNFALQLVAARRYYVEVLGLRHPFESQRYKGRVKFIDVNVFPLGDNKNGSAGDAIVNYHRLTDPPEGVEVVTIDLDAKLPRENRSPAHELFHVFQDGYSQFKNAWYYEGMARWAENILGQRMDAVGSVPANRADVEALFERRYDASRTWQALARASDSATRMRLPRDLRDARYIGSQKPIFKDDVFYGAAFLKALLEELDRADDVVAQEKDFNPLDWPEIQQRSSENNPVIWNAAVKVFHRFVPSQPIPDFTAAN